MSANNKITAASFLLPSSNGSHLRGSFAAATGETRRKGSASGAGAKTSLSPDASDPVPCVPTSLDELLKRAAEIPQPSAQENTLSSFTDASFDGGSQFNFGASRVLPSSDDFESTEALQQEISVLQHALISRFRGSQKAVSGCQFRMPSSKISKCEQCDSREKALAKARELIKKLKLQQERSQTTVSTKRPTEDVSADIKVQQLIAEKDELLRKCAQLNVEVTRLGALLSQRSTPPLVPASPSEGVKAMELQIQRLLEQNLMLSGVIQDLSHQKDALEARSTSLESQLEDKGRQHAELQEKYCKHEQEYTNEINSLKFQLKNEKANHAEALKALQASSSHELNVLKEKLSLVDTAKSSLSEQLRAAIDNLETARTNLITEKRTNLTIQEEKQMLSIKINELQQDVNVSHQELKLSQNEVLLSKEAIEKLKVRLQSMATEREQVLQTAISGSVRLCIVAPTVNVHVADKKLTFRSKVPIDELNQFLEREILSKYTFLFRQQSEETSPESGVGLQEFMQVSLNNMQRLIEGHIYTAMGTTAPTS